MPKTFTKSGIVQSFNISPKGSYEGMLIKEGKDQICQVNFPHHLSHSIAEAIKPGSNIVVQATEWKSDKPHAHPVFELESIKGKKLKDSADTFSGTVEQLNYALHGEVNGGILDSGDFLHLKPKGATALGLKIGMAVKGHGSRKPMTGGKFVIEAEAVNKVAIAPKTKPRKNATKKHASKKLAH